MLINAVFEQGQIRLPANFQFIHDFFQVKVDVPDIEVVKKQKVILDKTAPTQNCASIESQLSNKLNESDVEYSEFKELQDELFCEKYESITENTDREIIKDCRPEKDSILHSTIHDKSVPSNVDVTYTGEAAEFRTLTDALFGDAYQYVSEKSDHDILVEELVKKYA